MFWKLLLKCMRSMKFQATRRSVSGYNVKLEGAVVIVASGMQKSTTLSVTESETVSRVTCAQDMMYMNQNHFTIQATIICFFYNIFLLLIY